MIKYNDYQIMIILKEAGQISIEKHTETSGTLSLKLINNLTKEVAQTIDTVTATSFYYKVTIPELSEGEYTYELYDGTDKIESGLLYFGEINIAKTEYNQEKQVYVYGE